MAACEVCTGQDHGQQIVEVVRNAARQDAQALELLGVLQPSREDLALFLRADSIRSRILPQPDARVYTPRSRLPLAWIAKRPLWRGCTGSSLGQGQPPNWVRW